LPFDSATVNGSESSRPSDLMFSVNRSNISAGMCIHALLL
jgi:hypothetical protein